MSAELFKEYETLILALIGGITLLGVTSQVVAHSERMKLIRLGLVKPHKAVRGGYAVSDHLRQAIMVLAAAALVWYLSKVEWSWTLVLVGVLILSGLHEILAAFFGSPRRYEWR